MATDRGRLPRPLAAPMLLLIFWAICAVRVAAQLPPKTAGPDPVKSFCMRWWSQCESTYPSLRSKADDDDHAAVVKDRVLYIDSGIERFNDSGDVYLGISRFPWWFTNHDQSLNFTRQSYLEHQPH